MHPAARADLARCAAGANTEQDFTVARKPGAGGHAMLEPAVGVSDTAAAHPLALNDAGYGRDGSPIITWPATGSWNEELWPAS